MKNLKRITLQSCFLLFSFFLAKPVLGQTPTNFVLHGSFSNMEKIPAKVFVIYPAYLNIPEDSVAVTNGKYEVNGYIEEPAGVDISLEAKEDIQHQNDKFTVIVDKGELNIVSSGSFNQITVSGSASAAHQDFTNLVAEDRAKNIALAKEYTSDKANTDLEYKKTVREKYYYQISSSLNDLVVYCRKNPQSPITPYVTYILISTGLVTPPMGDTLEQNLPALNHPSKMRTTIVSIIKKRKEQQSQTAATIKGLDDKVLIGSKAPDFSQTDAGGKLISLSSLKGKYILIDFWASWCAPCRAENPNVVKVYHKYKDKGLVIIGVSLDGKTTKSAWLSAIKKDGLPWTEVSDLKGFDNEAAKLYGIHAIPQNFLLKANGVVIGKNLRGDELQKKIASLLD
jgi:peroxiredoxin